MSLARALVRLCYRLDNRPAYQRVKRRVRALMAGEEAHFQAYFDAFMSLLLLASVFVSLYQSVHGLRGYAASFDRLVVAVLVVEYWLRLWACSDIHRRVIEQYEHAELIGGRVSL